ncbi:hypothetical protein [Shimia sagamensis]|uniref:Uncharacterized protein n=1 Tax=Shimia sagamensis TaxID=1566352 RepID=A0ABY1P129_9RHOB|nr:hypothetical protein [Shimia sagamensis]SMP23693.1 hypothetical protein SAMN06265373_104409 [Shimia sagamensis]
MIRPFRNSLAALFLSTAALHAQTAPLSAIDWLDHTPTVTLDMGLPLYEAPVSEGVATPAINVSPLSETSQDAVGLLPSNVTGLPASLWSASEADTLSGLVAAQRPEVLPAMQALLYTLLLAEADAPRETGVTNELLLARVDKLVEMGALEQAEALLERAGPTTPSLFKRWFDVTLLMGQEARACEALIAAPHLATDYASRIFCTARAGDWRAAALTLDTAKALGLISEELDALLLRFLDPELFEGEPLLVAANGPDPLKFRLYEAIGEGQTAARLPRPYAHADLRDTAGWKAQLEAAERLARTSALHENALLGIYTEGSPSASGMIWDRVAALQAFDRAVTKQDLRDVSDTLPQAWAAMQQVHLEVPFARLYGPDLLQLPLQGVTARLARDIALLSSDYERAARSGPRDFLAGLALGTPPRKPTDPVHRAIADAFHDAGVPQEISSMLARGQLGESLLTAMELMNDGAAGNLGALTEALATFRAVGLEDTARRAALQVALLDTRG